MTPSRRVTLPPCKRGLHTPRLVVPRGLVHHSTESSSTGACVEICPIALKKTSACYEGYSNGAR